MHFGGVFSTNKCPADCHGGVAVRRGCGEHGFESVDAFVEASVLDPVVLDVIPYDLDRRTL